MLSRPSKREIYEDDRIPLGSEEATKIVDSVFKKFLEVFEEAERSGELRPLSDYDSIPLYSTILNYQKTCIFITVRR